MHSSVAWSWALWIPALLVGCGGEPPHRAIDAGTPPPPIPVLAFEAVTGEVGISHAHDFPPPATEYEFDYLIQTGGLAVGDFDGDGWTDLYAVGGAAEPDHLYRNRGDGTFEDATAGTGLVTLGENTNGAIFADYDGDGALDLIVGLLFSDRMVHLYRNQGDGTFVDEAATAGFVGTGQDRNWSTSMGDFDLDGDLDLFINHWRHWSEPTVFTSEHLWRNEGDGTFTNVGVESRVFEWLDYVVDWSFTTTFSDIDADGDPDLLIASDFLQAKVLSNNGDGTFDNITDANISSVQNAMGSAVTDFDNDGHLDWFVTSIYWPDAWGLYGNALYLGDGDGTFRDVAFDAGVDDGGWGWGVCAQDFDNDGWVDIFHASGYEPDGPDDPAMLEEPDRLFMSNRDGTYREVAQALGVDDPGAGTAVACFDYDHDGDIDIFVGNERGNLEVYRNELTEGHHHLQVTLRGAPLNGQGVGSRVTATIGALTQTREIHAGGSYLSQEMAEAHFGLGSALTVDELVVSWPDGEVSRLVNVPGDQRLVVEHPSAGTGG